MASGASDQTISTILRHDRKVTSYKIALLRAINDVALSFPDLHTYQKPIAVPLRILATWWLAYYWPFVDQESPIWQGPLVQKRTASDISFRAALTQLRQQWEQNIGTKSQAADGFFLANELRIARKRRQYQPALIEAYENTLDAIVKALRQPIRYAGIGEWQIFGPPTLYKNMQGVIATPGTQPEDLCLVIDVELWETFRRMSLWIEALCIHEWCLLSERFQREEQQVDRGRIYQLLTERPGNRVPLTWERNSINLLLLEGKQFTCPWTQLPIKKERYDLDHILPLTVYPINELWNLVPADPYFNSHTKRDLLPTLACLEQARPHLEQTYTHYEASLQLQKAIHEDAALRFSKVSPLVESGTATFPQAITQAVFDFLENIATYRNLARFDRKVK